MKTLFTKLPLKIIVVFALGMLTSASICFFLYHNNKLIIDLGQDSKNDRIIAKYDNKPVYLIEVEEALKAVNPDIKLDSLQPEVKTAVINQIITQKIVLQNALKAGSHKKIDMSLLNYSASNLVKQEFLMQNAKNSIKEADLKARYQELVDGLKGKKEYNIAHILVKTKSDANNAAYVARVSSFEKAVDRYSVDTQSATNGGKLGYILEGSVLPELQEALTKLKPGKVSKPVKTSLGFHIIKLFDVREAVPSKYEDVKSSIENALISEKVSSYLQDILKEVKVEIL